eukprot:TRINITY_DN858_c0_g2_i1.p1 TRINITY_DN858_c0_g2~~TRINITY_DN858_c0_g2_i1.p1  ORF type:complete len:136 (-),score=21.35 TRINITY_DN858_c0_g2_i1:655-1062(-)
MEQKTLQITTWNVMNPLFENERWYVADAAKYLHWNSGRQERALVYVTKLRSDVFSLQETTPQMAQQFATVLSEFHGIHYKYFWNQRNRSGKDGCGTIYNSDLLSVEETKTFHYPGYTHIYFAHKFSIKVKFRFMN